MADLIAIGYPDTTTALHAEEEVQKLAQDLVIQPDAVATIIRNEKRERPHHDRHEPSPGRQRGPPGGCSGGSSSESSFHPVLRHGHRGRHRGAPREGQQGRRR